MIINNILNGVLAFFMAIFLTIGFYLMFNGLIDLVPTEAKIFIGTIIAVVIIYVGFWAPLEIMVGDDKGDIN